MSSYNGRSIPVPAGPFGGHLWVDLRDTATPVPIHDMHDPDAMVSLWLWGWPERRIVCCGPAAPLPAK
jgi:hypothetical protein